LFDLAKESNGFSRPPDSTTLAPHRTSKLPDFPCTCKDCHYADFFPASFIVMTLSLLPPSRLTVYVGADSYRRIAAPAAAAVDASESRRQSTKTSGPRRRVIFKAPDSRPPPNSSERVRKAGLKDVTWHTFRLWPRDDAGMPEWRGRRNPL
jgi:hypothetical protein